MPRKTDTQTRFWFLTENNPTEESIERYKELDCQWIAISKEHDDDENKTPHIHVAFVFEKKRRWSTIKKLFPRADVEPMNGSPQSCVTYMTKENPLSFEKGERPEKDSRKKTSETNKRKWEDAYQAAKFGRFDEIPRDLYIRYDRAFHRIYDENQKDVLTEEYTDDDLKDHNLWLWGPTGTGKSHTARRIAKELDPEGRPYIKLLNKWWNGYKATWVTIIEEASPKSCEFLGSFIKTWCDKWDTSAEVKNSHYNQLRPHYIIVTSNYNIDECFPDPKESDPIHRRFTEVYLDKRYLEVQWPRNPEIKQNVGDGAASPAGNIIPQEEQEEAGVEPPSKKQKEGLEASETGLIEPPATLSHTPSDFNSSDLVE